MDLESIDWVFDTSREESFPKGGFMRWYVKRIVIVAILFVLAILAAIVTALVRARDAAPEPVFAVTMGALILAFCVFLVWMTYRRASRRSRRREAEDMALYREIAQYHREKRQQGDR